MFSRSFPVLLLAVAHGLGAQEPDTSPVRSIEARVVTSLGADGTGPALSRLTGLAMDREGRFFAAPTYEPGVIAVFDRDGRYLRSFGRLGRGPGEFMSPMLRLLVGPNDTVHVLDGIRHTVLRPGGEASVRTVQLPFVPGQAGLTGSGRLMAVSPLDGPEGLVHILSPDGEVERSLGPVQEREPDEPGRIGDLSNTHAGALWVGSPEGDRLEQWSMEGRLLRTLRTEVPGGARLIGLLQADSLLWTLVRVPDPDGSGDPITGRPVEEVDMDDHEDTIIAAIDLGTGEVIGRVRLDAAMSGFLGPVPASYSKRERDDGLIVVDVFVWSAG